MTTTLTEQTVRRIVREEFGKILKLTQMKRRLALIPEISELEQQELVGGAKRPARAVARTIRLR